MTIFNSIANTRVRRSVLLGSSALVVFGMGIHSSHAQVVVPPAGAECSISGTTATCTGDLSAGVEADGPAIDTLNVNSLTTPIMPGFEDRGIDFETTDGNNVTINADTGAMGITTDEADGIRGRVVGDGDVTIDSTGDIDTGTSGGGTGIKADVDNGNIDITSKGDIDSDSDSINAEVDGDGNITIDSTGHLTSDSAEGIEAEVKGNGGSEGNGDIKITSKGHIKANDFAISAKVKNDGDITINNDGMLVSDNNSGIRAEIEDGNGDIKITSKGDIEADERGIEAEVDGDGNIAIDSDGVIDSRKEGILAEADGDGDITVTSEGDIFSDEEAGIKADQKGKGDVTVSSTGDIDADHRGIDAESDEGDVKITSKGDVDSDGEEGIYGKADGDGNVVIDSTGDVVADKEGIYGEADGNGDTTIKSTGDVTSDNDAGIYGKSNDDGDVTIVSKGDVTGDEEGIRAQVDDGNIAVTHLGGTVTGDTGIRIQRDTGSFAASVSTFGGVTGTGDTAIDFQGDGNDTLNLGPGTVISGTVDMGNGNGIGPMGTPGNTDDIDTLNALPGFNGVVVFADSGVGAGDGQADGDDVQSAPEIVGSNIAILPDGVTAVAVDPSGFAAPGVFLGKFTRAIFNSIDNNGPAPDNGVSNQYGLGVLTHAYGGSSTHETGSGMRWWASGFGGQQEVEASGNYVELDHDFAGLMIGAENEMENGTAGFFVGYGQSDIGIDFGAGNTEVDSFFGGGYWKKDYVSHRINLAFAGGTANHEFTRNIGGAVPTVANGDADGWFIAPSATIAAPIKAFSVPVIASARIGYSGLFLDGYTETGTVANPMTVSDRDVHLINARAQLALPHYVAHENGSRSNFELRVGVDGQNNLSSDNVSAMIGGTAINFDADLDDQVSAFVGASVTLNNSDETIAFTFSGELSSTFDGGYGSEGQAKISFKF